MISRQKLPVTQFDIAIAEITRGYSCRLLHQWRVHPMEKPREIVFQTESLPLALTRLSSGAFLTFINIALTSAHVFLFPFLLCRLSQQLLLFYTAARILFLYLRYIDIQAHSQDCSDAYLCTPTSTCVFPFRAQRKIV